MHGPHGSSHHRSHVQRTLERQIDLAVAAEAKRRREQQNGALPPRAGGGFARSLVTLTIVLIVFGLLLAQASRAGLL